MQRKHNPYVALVALMLIAIITVWICAGCHAETEDTEQNQRFTVETHSVAGHVLQIITDNENGVQYLFYSYRNTDAGGITKLEVQP